MPEDYPTPPQDLVGEWLCDDGYPWDPSEQVTITITITTNRLRNVAALAEPEPEGPTMFKPDGVHPFVVRHYTDDERPSIKGNGFDGLEVGEDRQEAEEFIAWINARLCPSRSN